MTSPRRVAVANSAQTVFAYSSPGLQHIDLITAAAVEALKGTGIRIDDIDFVIDSGSDFLDGRSISNCGFLGAMGANRKEESRVEEDGLWSLSYAANKIAGGSAEVGLVIAYAKPSESDNRNFWTGLLEPFLQRPTGFDHLAAAGLSAQSYLARAGLEADVLRQVTHKNWHAAAANPEIEFDEVPSGREFWSESVATPLRRSDLAHPADGAVAVLLTTGHIADQISPRPIWLGGIGSAIDQHFFSARELDSLPAAAAAARTALDRAGSPLATDFDVVEVSASSTVGELMVLEALGLAEPYSAIELYREGAGLNINRSGGALPADVVMASGLARLHSAASQLRDGAREDQRTALVHGTGGFAMQNHCVVTLEAAA
ncbi:3-ketoacyl-CoA thiolase [Salinibacterium sp. ZJ454]|uniref:thiolase C-terminal domain-containing protein n=1 Tax=Salinibacterium sp. ZJ454 TaxID=2708339 RepID=UPI0014248F82|nr:3-ketoacyl-CoA thiolase [Salinibacterium sp. ZJ454]